MSHLSAGQWISPLNLPFPVLNDHEQVAHWTADTLRVAIVTPQATYLKKKKKKKEEESRRGGWHAAAFY